MVGSEGLTVVEQLAGREEEAELRAVRIRKVAVVAVEGRCISREVEVGEEGEVVVPQATTRYSMTKFAFEQNRA